MNNIITEANRRISELQSLLANVKPPWEYVQGRLRISHDKGKVRYYLQGQRGEKDQYLSKKEMARIRSLAQNDYDEKILKLANEELDYLANGYFPGINLIQTFESQKHPLSGPTIESVIDTYFYVA